MLFILNRNNINLPHCFTEFDNSGLRIKKKIIFGLASDFFAANKPFNQSGSLEGGEEEFWGNCLVSQD